MILEKLFEQLEVPLWGIASLRKAVQGAHEYKCIAFCMPYDSAAVEALPDERLINRCRSDLGERTKRVYEAITEELSEYAFVFYHDVDRELGLRGRGVSQKVLGHLAGLGWIGRSSLLVTPEFGPRVRVGTVFTEDDVGLTGQPHLGDCGDCMACSEACPAGAISRSAYNVSACRQIVTDAQCEHKTFCGLCMQVCPIGRVSNPMQQTRANRAADACR